MGGFQSQDFKINCDALSLLFMILIKMNDITPFMVFQKPLFELFTKVVQTGDHKLLTQFLEPISVGLNNNILFLPFEQVFQVIISVLVSECSIEFKYPLNTLFGLYLQVIHDSISLENLKSFYDMEIQLVIQFYDLSNDDMVLGWLYDCNNVFEGIFMRIPEESVVEMSMESFQRILQNDEPRYRLCAVALITTAINMVPQNFSNLVVSLYPQILAFLWDSDCFVQDFTSDSLAGIAQYFPDFITSNIITIVQSVLMFIQSTGDSRGTHLLSSIMEYTLQSDELYPTLMPIVLEWTTSSESMIAQDACSIIRSMIATSQTQIPYYVEQIAATVFQILHENMESHFHAFVIIEALCRYTSDLMKFHKDQLLPIIMNGIHFPDNTVKLEALKAIETLPQVIMDDPNFSTYIMNISSELIQLATIPYDKSGPIDEQQLSVSGLAVYQASIFCFYYNDTSSQLPNVLSAVVYVAQMPSTSSLNYSAMSIQVLANLISSYGADIEAVTNPTEEMIALLINKLADSSRYEFSLLGNIIAAIASIIKMCGEDILKHKEIELIRILSNVLTQTMNPYTGSFICPGDLLVPISDLLTGIAFSTEGNTKEILDEIVPLLTNFLNHKSYQYQVFSMQTFAELTSRNSTLSLLPEKFKTDLIQLIIHRVVEDIPQIASAAARFIYQISKNEESVPLLMPYIENDLSALLNRLNNVTQLTTENILMRENILLAIASIGSYVLEDRFPVAETMPSILKALPITKQFETCNEIYKFLNSMSYVVNDEQKLEYIRIYAWVIARPEMQMVKMNIKMFILVNMGSVLKKFLDEYPPEQQQAIISQVLNHDEYKMSCFYAGFESLRGMAHQFGSIP